MVPYLDSRFLAASGVSAATSGICSRSCKSDFLPDDGPIYVR